MERIFAKREHVLETRMARLEGFEPTTPGSEARSELCWSMFSNTNPSFVVGGRISFCIWGGDEFVSKMLAKFYLYSGFTLSGRSAHSS
jgi:hypothetical protein